MRSHLFIPLRYQLIELHPTLPPTDTQYSRTGLILALSRIKRYLNGKVFLMQARTATRRN